MTNINNIIICGLDLETTGFINPDHRIVETYNGLWRNGQKVFEYEQRIDPQRGMPAEAQRVHHISAHDLIGQPTWEKVAPAQMKVLSKAHMVVAHNAEFDWGFLTQEFKRVGMKPPDIPVFDTMAEGVWATPDGKMPRLEELCFACEVDYDPALAHAAKYDVERMMDCFFKGLEWGFYELPEVLRQSRKE